MNLEKNEKKILRKKNRSDFLYFIHIKIRYLTPQKTVIVRHLCPFLELKTNRTVLELGE